MEDLMRKTNFTHEWKSQISRKLRLLSISLVFIALGLNQASAQCALACNSNTQVSLDENCEAEITPDMILNANQTICPRGIFEVTVSYHGKPIPSSPVVTCDYINHTLEVMVRDTRSGNSCWGEIFVEDKLPPVIECGSDTLYCYQMKKYTGPIITDNCTKAAIISQILYSELDEAMDEVFGSGNWDQYQYSTVDVDDLLTCRYDVIYLDGFTINNLFLQDFVDDNRQRIEDWVANGGSLFINGSAIIGNFDFGFGGVSIGQFQTSDTAFVNDDSHPIFQGPVCPSLGDELTGELQIFFFTIPIPVSATVICPPGMNPLLVSEDGATLLLEAHHGAGTVMFGTLIPSVLLVPEEEARNLRQNILHHLRDASPNKVEMTLLDERLFPMSCPGEFIKRVERDYQATDHVGNKSSICTQTLYLRRFPVQEVSELGDTTRVACEDIINGVIPTLPNGAPRPEYIGVPQIDGIDLWPPQDFYCDISVSFDDVILPKLGCVQKVMRVWTIDELCTPRPETRRQFIEIVDENPPVIAPLPDTIRKTTKGGYVCEADVYLPAASATDVCNGGAAITVDVRYPGGFLDNMTGGLVQLPVGIHEVTYLVYDGCYNLDSAKVIVEVQDLTPPVAVCDRYTVVGLTYDSVAHVYAETFDDGTYDDCYIDRFEVLRMDRGAACGVIDSNFKEYVEFCCNDIDPQNNVMVIFRAWDKAGNYNDCMVEVEVQDKILPHIYCPPNITVSCDFHYNPNDLAASFGDVRTDKSLREAIDLSSDPNASADGQLIDGHAYDNCSVVVTRDSVTDISQCNVGTITRTFTATDANGSVSCTQTITFENFHPFNGRTDITWPAEFDTIGCVDPLTLTEDITGKPIFKEDECDLVGYSFDDHIFPFFNTPQGNGACLKIIRKWKVIDWCNFSFDPTTGRYEYDKYEYEQIIKVSDDVDPTFSFVTPDTMFCDIDSTCDVGPANLIAIGQDSCTPASELRWEYHIDFNDDGIYDTIAVGQGDTIDASGMYAYGDHRIKYVFEDRCGNKIAEERLFSIVNCKSPSPYCKNGVVINLMAMDTNRDGTPDIGMIEVWASDLDLGSTGACGNPVILSFSTDTTERNRMFDCDSIGQRNVDIWVTDRITGEQLNCKTFVIIQDNQGVCNDSITGGNVSGLISTTDKLGIKDVEVDLKGSPFTNVMSDKQGGYAFPMMAFGGTYNVQPVKNDDYMNGISTRDLVFMQRHLLGKEELDTPYKRIAADVNGDTDISVNDIVELRRLILGVYDELPNNNSWRFVDAAYVFPDPSDPFTPAFPEKYVIDNFLSNMADINFVGLKVGDVDNSVDPNGLNGNKTRNDNSLVLNAEEVAFNNGEDVSLELRASAFNEITGYQFTLNFDPAVLEFAAIDNGAVEMSDANLGLNFINDGIINVSWNNANGITALDNDILFTITFVAQTNGVLSDIVSINSRMVEAEAYNALDDVMNIQLGFNGQDGEQVSFRLYQNHPNPFEDATVIGFDLPEDGDVQLTIYDVTGKVVALYRLAGTKGYNSAQIYSNDLTSTGVLYYQLDSKGYTATKKMVVLQ